jgi:hypothetical protein
MFVTSLVEMFVPSCSDFIRVLPNKNIDLPDDMGVKMMISGEGDRRFKPKFGVSPGRRDVDVASPFFATVEKEAIRAYSKESRRHAIRPPLY